MRVVVVEVHKFKTIYLLAYDFINGSHDRTRTSMPLMV